MRRVAPWRVRVSIASDMTALLAVQLFFEVNYTELNPIIAFEGTCLLLNVPALFIETYCV